MNILILGASGFIGSEITRRLACDGYNVTGLCRKLSQTGRLNLNQNVKWLQADLSKLTQAADWTPILADTEIVVNCAGALQDGPRDNLAATQDRAMRALYAAARPTTKIIQISANTEASCADTVFLATKRAADEALASSGLPHVILRPALVIGRNAYGGTALIRALAALPWLLPLLHADSQIATVSLDDVVEAVSCAVTGAIPDGSDLHLAAHETISLADLVRLHRQWLGLAPAPIAPLPALIGAPVGWIADGLGRLGWRSPLRSTALRVMTGGVLADGKATQQTERLLTARETLARHPSGAQDLWFARLYLLKPAVFAVLSIFWILSGMIPLLDPMQSGRNFLPYMPESAALALTIATCFLDIALGACVAVRAWAGKALVGMILVSLAYLAGGTVMQPGLWLDPLGPLIKVAPSIMLTLVALAILEER